MPPEPQAFLNGQFVPAHQALVATSDAGFVQGTTVAEQLRTFGGRLYQLEQHVERLFHSLQIIEIDPGLAREDFIRLAEELVAANHPLLAPGDDLGLAMFVTPGPYSAMAPTGPPTVCLHTFPIRFGGWASKFQQGEALATTDVRQVPTECWPPELKCRSRMHYYLADRQAAKLFPGSRALMLDLEGFVVEATTANVVLYREIDGLLLLPPARKILPGISQAVLLEIAAELGIAASHRDLLPADVAAADEVFLTSTSPCMLPVVRFNGQPIADGRPGHLYVSCMAAWSARVGVDIIAQAQQFAVR